VGVGSLRAGAGLGIGVETAAATEQAAAGALAGLNGDRPDLGVVFATPQHFREARTVIRAFQACAGPVPTIGCIAESVVAGGREIESEPAVSVWVATGLDDVSTYHMEFMRTESGGVFSGWRFDLEPSGVNLLVADPFTFPAALLLEHLNQNAPSTQIVGGMASGGIQFRESRLFLDDAVVRTGAVGARISGIDVRTLVSQGCRPVGSPYTVTGTEGSIITGLGGQPPLERLTELAASLPPSERELLTTGLHVGRVIEAVGKTELESGDFLVRTVAGVDPETGAIALGEPVDVGEVVQFHVRDAASADRDLRIRLERETAALGALHPAAGLLFTCNGRGSRMFEEPDHDARLVADAFGGAPLAGFFCAGELGPVAGKNFLHGFTASVAVFVGDGAGRQGAG
jgi:small ligand-binding sensory domain FIST